MAQLVGSICALCDKRISSILDGRFCKACGAPVHNECINPDLDAKDEDYCDLCGSDLYVVREILEEAASKKSQNRYKVKDLFAGYKRLRTMWRCSWYFAGSLAAVLLGVWLIRYPDLTARPSNFTLNEILPGLAAVIAGLCGMGLSAYCWPRKKR
jgi:hypothetical protein